MNFCWKYFGGNRWQELLINTQLQETIPHARKKKEPCVFIMVKAGQPGWNTANEKNIEGEEGEEGSSVPIILGSPHDMEFRTIQSLIVCTEGMTSWCLSQVCCLPLHVIHSATAYWVITWESWLFQQTWILSPHESDDLD